MADTPIQNGFYQAPLEVPGYVNQSASVVPPQPIDLYGLMQVYPPKKNKLATRAKTPYELMMEGSDPFAGLIPDVAPLRTNEATITPLDDPAGLFHSQDGFGKYGYSSILGGGDNEARYAQNFRNDNPDLFFQPGFHPWDGLKKAFYWGGGFLEKTLESAVVKTGQGFGGLFGMTIGNLGNLLSGNESYSGFQDWLSKSSDNIMSSLFNNWDENLKERYHYFQEKNDRDRKGFIQSLGDGDFWMNDISDGLGFLVSSMFEAGAISKLGLGTKVASRLAPFAEGVSAEALAGEGLALSRTAGIEKALANLGITRPSNAFIKNAVDLTTQTIALTAIESATEAQETKDQIYRSLENRVNPETGYLYTEDEKQRLAAAGAAQVFKQNMTILAGPKFLETLVFNRVGNYAKGLFNKAFGRATTEAGRASNNVGLRSRLGNLASGVSYNKTSALQNVLKVGSLAGVGFLSEGLFEENVQLAISRSAQEAFGGGDEYYRPGTTNQAISELERDDDLFGSTGRRYIRQTRQFFRGATGRGEVDDELSKSIGIGGLFGIGGGAIHASLGIRQQAKVDAFWTDRLNKATTNLFESQSFYQTRIEERPDPNQPGKTIPTPVIVTDPSTGNPVLDQNKLMNFLNKMNNIQGIMDIIANTEDPSNEDNQTYQNKELNKLARNVLFVQLAMEYIRAGKKDLLLSSLTSSSQFSDKDIQALGYTPGMMNEEEKKQMLAKMTNMVDRLSKADEWIEDNVLDNVSEKRQGKFGLAYTKTQKEKRRQEFEAKKAYLRGLAMQNALLDSYLDEINQSEALLGIDTGIDASNTPLEMITSMTNYSTRVPALKNQIAILEKAFAHYLDNFEEAQAELNEAINRGERPADSDRLSYLQAKVEETLERINDLQSEYDDLTSQRNAFLNQNEDFTLVDEDGNEVTEETDPNQTYYVARKRSVESVPIQELNNEKQRRINAVKREEIGIQKGWIEDEWRLTAALKEPKVEAGRKDTYFSRRMSLSRNAYNTYFQREVLTRDNSLGQRKLRLYYSDESKRVTAKQYKANEEKILNSVRIRGKVLSVVADVNGQKLISEINALLDRDLPTEEFAAELDKIINIYNGLPMIISEEDKELVDEQIINTQEEESFVAGIFEFFPLDDRFNDKYYEQDAQGNWQVKPEYDDLQALAIASRELRERVDDLKKIRRFLKSIPESVPGDWSNPDMVRRRIADVYFESPDSIINAYNQLTNDGQLEIGGDSFNSKQDLDKIEEDINELTQLKKIFEDRDKTDNILSLDEFDDFIQTIDKKIADLEKIRDVVKERVSSRLRENQDFLIDTVTGIVEQVGVGFDGSTKNEPLKNIIDGLIGTDPISKLVNQLTDLQQLINKEDKTAEDKKVLEDSYWTINGQISAIQEMIKSKDKTKVLEELAKQKKEQITKLESTALMQRLKSDSFYKDIINNIDDSLLGTLQLIFYSHLFSNIGYQGEGLIDDKPSSPVYKFREDYNLRKFLRNVEKDNSRTPENSEITKEALLEFLSVAQEIQTLESAQSNLKTSLNLLDEVEREKQVVQAKIDKKDNQYDNLIVPSIQQLFFIRKIANFLRTEMFTGDKPGFRNWIYIQAPGGAGKTQTLGTWFNSISGIPRDRVLATSFTEEAARSIKRALLVGEDGPRNVGEMSDYITQLTKDKNFDQDVLIIDEFPAIDVVAQKKLFDAVTEYTLAKKKAGKGEFKVITMGDTNQLTFNDDGSVLPRPSILVNPGYFSKDRNKIDNHPAQMTIIPSLTVNFRSNLFAVTSFIDNFKGSNEDNVNKAIKVTSSDPTLNSPDIKGVVAVNTADFQSRIINYLKNTASSTRTKAIIVNENKIDQYKRLLQANGITVIEDPNNEVTKGVYVSSVRNTQGFSFDEVFIDLDNKDKVLFTSSASPNFNYNKAMYVAASRARNLIVVTNFPNFENVEDSSISALEAKAIAELQTKDKDFITQRDLEIGGAKSVIGSEYSKSVTTPAPTKATEAVETPLDQEEPETEEEEEEITEAEIEEALREDEDQEEQRVIPDEVQEEEIQAPEEEEGANESTGNQILPTSGIEDPLEEENAESQENLDRDVEEMNSNIMDKATTAFNKVKKAVIELLFPTGATTKYIVSQGEFVTKTPEVYENKNLSEGDRIILIPFNKDANSKSPRNFGYAIITPAIDQEGKEIPNNYRTVAILSDKEIDDLKEKPQTSDIYNTIVQNETRDKGFVSIEYTDVSNPNGFNSSSSKIVNDIYEGKVTYSQPLKYFYGKDYQELNEKTFNDIIKTFIHQYYQNHLNSFPPAQRQTELDKIEKFYRQSRNAQIIIPTNKDVIGTEKRKPLLNIPPELAQTMQKGVGRPYIMFRSYHKRGSMQFIPLSRKFLNASIHNEEISPIREFITTGRQVRTMLEKKGVEGKLGYTRILANGLSRLSSMYLEDQEASNYKIKIGDKEYTFSNIEAERVYNFYSMYSEPSQFQLISQNEAEIRNLINLRRARNYKFEDGETIYGRITSYNTDNKTFTVLDVRTGEETTKSGVIKHTKRTVAGPAQQALDSIMNSNGNIASKFTAMRGRTGFVTDRDVSGQPSEFNRGYKFMALLGSKTGPVARSYNEDGSVKEYYSDVIDILEDLFNFETGLTKNELPGRSKNYLNIDGQVQDIQVKFRVPVPLSSTNDSNGELEFDYSFSPQNTSRDLPVTNSRFFESNFESMLPTRVFVEFGEQEEETPEQENTEQNVVEQTQQEVTETQNINTLTKEEYQALTIEEIKSRLSKDQLDRVDTYAKSEGFTDANEFFEIITSINGPEQDLFKDQLINCII